MCRRNRALRAHTGPIEGVCKGKMPPFAPSSRPQNQSAKRQASYRARLKAGKCVVRVEVDREILDFLVGKAKWLTDRCRGLGPGAGRYSHSGGACGCRPRA